MATSWTHDTALSQGRLQNKIRGLNMSGGPARPNQKFLGTFFCFEAIKSKQMPMCQKAKNSKKNLKYLLNNFGKSEKGASKIPKVRGGGVKGFLEKTHI